MKPCWWPGCPALPSVKVSVVDSSRSTVYTCQSHLRPLQHALRRKVLTFKPIIHLTHPDPPIPS